jgi:hypothetical protein
LSCAWRTTCRYLTLPPANTISGFSFCFFNTANIDRRTLV